MSFKSITFTVPCFNSSEYMDKCVSSLVSLNNKDDDIEIIIVDDGSSDDTYTKACSWVDRYPNIVRAIHQENGGHGAAVNKGLEKARGVYFKVVDSDDWLDNKSGQSVMKYVREQAGHVKDKQKEDNSTTDMIIFNYVYELVHENKTRSINYKNCLPQNKIFTWSDVKRFRIDQYLLMHSVIYRTQLLLDIDFKLPRHTFYVDNIFVYVPLPYVKSMYYINADFYRYFIGRDDQSVNTNIMIKRIDQQLKITRIMIDGCSYKTMSKYPNLKNYMIKYLSIMMCICSIFLQMIGTDEANKKRLSVWEYLKNSDTQLYRECRRSVLCKLTNISGSFGRLLSRWGYRIARKWAKFN